ncbi:MAG: phosphotransferase family protein, partial [Actinomycetota bacterium]
MTEPLPGLDPGPVGRWLAEQEVGQPPFAFELVAAGGSNLTYRVTDGAGATTALRRPPEGRALATAHDVDREWRILTALAAVPEVPTPDPIARCDDVEVTGAPFYVMAFVDGAILRTAADADELDSTAGTRAAESLVGVQAALHALDVDEVGLGDLGRRTGYVDRQLRRWMTQVEQASARDLGAFTRVHRALSDSAPTEDPTPALVHGDYRFDNVVLGADHAVAAVLDWELCTLGDPAADACWSLQYSATAQARSGRDGLRVGEEGRNVTSSPSSAQYCSDQHASAAGSPSVHSSQSRT